MGTVSNFLFRIDEEETVYYARVIDSLFILPLLPHKPLLFFTYLTTWPSKTDTHGAYFDFG
jgi:hypothetical protein